MEHQRLVVLVRDIPDHYRRSSIFLGLLNPAYANWVDDELVLGFFDRKLSSAGPQGSFRIKKWSA